MAEEHFDTVSGEEDWGPRYNLMKFGPGVKLFRREMQQSAAVFASRICG